MLIELGVVEQRHKAVLEVMEGLPVTEVAGRYGVTRQTVHRWLRWYAQGGIAALAGGDEEALEAARDVAAVLEREAALRAERAGPGEEPLVTAPVGRHGELAAHLAGGGLEGDDGVAVLVRVDAEYHHELSPFGPILRSAGPSADTP